jgi:hypothetical protein
MKAPADTELLQKLRLARADFVTAMSTESRAPHPNSLRSLAELQLVIMATEAVIADKADVHFHHQFREQAA